MLEAVLITGGLAAIAAAVLVAGRSVARAIAKADEAREKRIRTWTALVATRNHVEGRTRS